MGITVKHSFHILLLFITLLWTCTPTGSTQHRALHDKPTTHYLQTELASQVILVNLPVKSDTRVDLSVSAVLPDLPQREVVGFIRRSSWAREFASFIESHHIYTQITSSYL